MGGTGAVFEWEVLVMEDGLESCGGEIEAALLRVALRYVHGETGWEELFN